MASTQGDFSAVRWRKSTYSNGDGGNCIEVGEFVPDSAPWRKSTYSNGSGGNCLEVAAPHNGVVPVRDSKTAPHGAVLTFSGPEWARFIAGIRGGTLSG